MNYKESRLVNSLRNVVFGLLKYSVSIIFPFITRTVIIYSMGKEYVGINSLFSSILQVLSLSELGFSNAIVFYMYAPIAKGDTDKVCSLLNLFRKIYRICGFVILGVGIAISPFVDRLIKGDYPASINIYFVFIMLVFNTALSYFFCGYKTALFIAYQRSDIESKVQIFSNLLMNLLQILVIVFFHNYYLFVICMLCATLFSNYLLYYFSKKHFPQIKSQGVLDTYEKKNIYAKVKALFGHQLDAVIINSVDNIVISTFLGLNVLTNYSNYYFIVNAVISIVIMIANSFVASIGNGIAVDSVDDNYSFFMTFNYAIGLINIVCSSLMIVLYQDFMYIWMGTDGLLGLSTVICLVLSFYCRQMRRGVLTYKNAIGIWQEDKFKPYVAAITNLILNIVLVNMIGLNGVVISTIISVIFIETPWETIILFKVYFKKGLKKFIFSQIYVGIKLVLVGFVSYFVLRLFIVESIWGFALKLLSSCVFVVFITILFSIWDKELVKILKIIKRVFHL